MLDRTDDISIAAENWLAQFETALAEPDDGVLKTLFHPDSHWRDVLALSWNLQTINGADAILAEHLPDRSRARCAAPGDPRRHRRDRSDFQIRDRARPRQRNSAADPRRRR